MNLILHYVPNMEYFLSTVNRCNGMVMIELKDQSYLNLKGEGEGKFYLESVGEKTNGLRVLTEKKEDAVTLLKALLVS
ncbi:MAG: hypothetical protein PHE02_03770 [Lachnospiraceae bacterium]|nr:hypothetical protein [Lachnospiraceae bacterium]